MLQFIMLLYSESIWQDTILLIFGGWKWIYVALLFYPEDEGSIFLQNATKLQPE
jgi:hypothetical protein